jgi:putative endonuclease
MSRVEGRPYFVYVLWSDAGSRFYLGISEDPERRLQQHNSASSVWTSRYSDWRLVHVEQYLNYTRARKRELVLKKQKGGSGFYKLLGRTREQLLGARPPSGT